MPIRKLKIAFDASPLVAKRTGVAYYNKQLIEALAAKYPTIEFVGFYYNFLGRHNTDYLPRAKNIRYRPNRLIPNKVVFQLRRWGMSPPLELLLKERADFVLYGNFWGYPSLLNIPAAPVVHDLTYLDTPEFVTAKNRRDLTRWVPKQIKRSRFIITVSDFSKKNIQRAYDIKSKDILVTPIPPPKPANVSDTKQKQTLKKLDLNKPFILFLGTIEPRKNIVNLIDAYQNLPRKTRQQYSLVLAGRVGWHCTIELERIKQAQQAGLDVVHVGYIDDTTKAVLYANTTLFASASHYEGFGMPVLEAMSYGAPCAVNKIPVFKEVAGMAAVYFDGEDVQDITQKLDNTLQDKKLRQKLHKLSLQQVKEYDWDAVASKVMECIQLALGDR